MAETAVGLFEQPGTADTVANALRANGFPTSGIRVLSKPAAMLVEGATSTPSVDFTAAISRNLHSMGATDSECRTYLEGLRRGNVIVFATGSHDQAESALGVMSEYEPVEAKEYTSPVPELPSTRVGEIGAHDIRSKIEHSREKSEGIRVFSW
jgi:hypothetical protein